VVQGLNKKFSKPTSINQSISDFVEWPKWPKSLQGPLKC